MMSNTVNNNVTVVIVNLLTLDLTRTCYGGLRRYYPLVPVIFVDNGSRDESTKYIVARGREPNVTAIVNERNLGHGPALHQGTVAAGTRYVFALDSDCEVLRGGFLELMLSRFKEDLKLFMLGRLMWATMFDVETYIFLQRPFKHHGSPAGGAFRHARRQGYRCDFDSFPIGDYVAHAGMGTRRLFGGAGTAWKPTPEMIRRVREGKRYDEIEEGK